MQFNIPQFIYREPKIVGPLTFKQFIYIGAAGAVCFVLYFTMAKKNVVAFLIISAAVMIISLFFAFGQIGGRSFTTVVANFFIFSFSRKLYLWKKKEVPMKIMMKPRVKEEKEDKIAKVPSLKIAARSRLKELSSQIETKIR